MEGISCNWEYYL